MMKNYSEIKERSNQEIKLQDSLVLDEHCTVCGTVANDTAAEEKRLQELIKTCTVCSGCDLDIRL
jgi:hypothetical protein